MGDWDIGILRNGGWSSGSCVGRSVIIGCVGSNGGFLFYIIWEGTGFRDGSRVFGITIERPLLCLFFAAVLGGERREESRHYGAVRTAPKRGVSVCESAEGKFGRVGEKWVRGEPVRSCMFAMEPSTS
jgi:hypothetical protein